MRRAGGHPGHPRRSGPRVDARGWREQHARNSRSNAGGDPRSPGGRAAHPCRRGPRPRRPRRRPRRSRSTQGASWTSWARLHLLIPSTGGSATSKPTRPGAHRRHRGRGTTKPCAQDAAPETAGQAAPLRSDGPGEGGTVLSTLSPVSAGSLGLTVLGRDDWRSSLAATVDAPPGADPLVADALARGRKGRADALLIESRAGASLLPVVRHHRRVGDVVEALPHGISGGPVTVFGDPPPAQAAAVRRVLGRTTRQRRRASSACLGPSSRPDHHPRARVGPRSPAAARARATQAPERCSRGDRGAAGRPTRCSVVAADPRRSRRRPRRNAIHGRPDRPRRDVRAGTRRASLDDRDISAALFLHSPLEVFYWLGGTLPGHEHSFAVACRDRRGDSLRG